MLPLLLISNFILLWFKKILHGNTFQNALRRTLGPDIWSLLETEPVSCGCCWVARFVCVSDLPGLRCELGPAVPLVEGGGLMSPTAAADTTAPPFSPVGFASCILTIRYYLARNNVEHLFMRLSTVCMSTLDKCVLRSFARL